MLSSLNKIRTICNIYEALRRTYRYYTKLHVKKMSNNKNQQHKSKPQSQLLPPSPATKSKISNINVESTLRASLLKHSQQRQSGNNSKKVKSAGQLWYEKLPINEQQQVIIGINALLYKGCMNAAKRTFDTVVRQEMANELHNGGSVDQVRLF